MPGRADSARIAKISKIAKAKSWQLLKFWQFWQLLDHIQRQVDLRHLACHGVGG